MFSDNKNDFACHLPTDEDICYVTSFRRGIDVFNILFFSFLEFSFRFCYFLLFFENTKLLRMYCRHARTMKKLNIEITKYVVEGKGGSKSTISNQQPQKKKCCRGDI